MEYVDQSADSLILKVFDKPIDVSQFTLLSSGSIVDSSFGEIKAHIIGESHIVVLEFNGTTLCEIFSCGPVKSDFEPVLELSVVSMMDQDANEVDFGNYYFSMKLKDFSSAQPLINEFETNLVLKNPIHFGLSFDFPHEGTHVPKTIVLVQIKGKKDIFVNSVHSYPNEDKVVFTETMVKDFLRKGFAHEES